LLLLRAGFESGRLKELMHLHANANPICDRQFVRNAALQIWKPALTDAASTPLAKARVACYIRFCSI
jgi:hypothetical protein